jgi:hypothetical protein
MQVRVEAQERYWYPDDGGQVWVAGYQLLDDDGRFMGREAARRRGLIVTGVAGAGAHHAEPLQSEDAAPGRPLALVRDPGNEHDANAIAVETVPGAGGDSPAAGGDSGRMGGDPPAPGVRLGFIPRELAAELAPRLDAGEPFSALVLREQRPSPRDPRTGLTMLIAQGATLELAVPRD